MKLELLLWNSAYPRKHDPLPCSKLAPSIVARWHHGEPAIVIALLVQFIAFRILEKLRESNPRNQRQNRH
jgi:hypothetical protein